MSSVIRWTALAFLLVPGCASTAPPRSQGGEQEAPVTSGPVAPPWRYDDHYGFNRLSTFAY